MKTHKLPNLGKFKRVQNLRSNSGNDIANQFEIEFENGTIFQSYESIIVVKFLDEVYIGKDWDYSTTTGKYRNIFLNETKQETKKKLDNGDYLYLNQ